MLERGLGDGAAITVERSWQVQFDRQARGIIVSGQQIAAKVSAPPHLAQFARLEEARDPATMFPMMLSDAGLILSGGTAPGTDDDVAAALRSAEALIASQPVPAEEREAFRSFLAQVHTAGSGQLDTMPADLLFPARQPVNRTETVALPGGLTGSFTLQYEAQPQPDAPWLQQAERRIVTRVEGLERRAREAWTLGPLQP
ncbi:hypothetical protein IP79_08215 [Porphyrobacter sp. AAP60]|nr:hypothetical protein IP79_08215 [Porphyrobacter sp. AAP60]